MRCRRRLPRVRRVPAVEDTLTMALGADLRSSGSSASVRRTCASKLMAMVRLTFS